MTESPAPVVVLDAQVGPPWRRFLEQIEPLRPDLFRYCRYLTRSPWDAEDLVQECLARAFVTLAGLSSGIEQPRAWLFRVAYHIYLNQTRRSRERPGVEPELAEQATPAVEARETREAAGLVITRLAPQERAALVLKEVFDFKLEEIADTLSTSVGAVKAALHRGRGKLLDSEPELGSAPHPAVLDAFVDAFNRRDLDGLTALLLGSVVVEFPGLHVEYGAETAKRQSLRGVLQGSPEAGIAPSFREGLLAVPPRLELRSYRGATILLAWFAHRDGDAVRAVSMLDVEGERISHMRTYMHHPELVAEVCQELGVPFQSNGYRPWW